MKHRTYYQVEYRGADMATGLWLQGAKFADIDEAREYAAGRVRMVAETSPTEFRIVKVTEAREVTG